MSMSKSIPYSHNYTILLKISNGIVVRSRDTYRHRCNFDTSSWPMYIIHCITDHLYEIICADFAVLFVEDIKLQVRIEIVQCTQTCNVLILWT